MSRTPSRRAMLTGAAALPLTALPAVALAATDPALPGIAETRAILDRALAIEAASVANLPPTWGVTVDEAVAALARIPAPTTLAGAQALARLTVDLRSGLGLDLDEEMPRILERIAGGAAAVALALPTAASVVSPSGPDAELIRLGAELDEAWAAERPLAERARLLGTLEAEVPFETAMDQTGVIVGRIAEATATTLAGLMVKARACSWCRNGQPFTDTTFNHQGTTDVSLAAGVLRDLLAMGGQV